MFNILNSNFYIFAIFSLILIFSATMVLFSKNPIHSILWLVLVFFSSTTLLLIIRIEFLAMLLLVVYIGAIMVLFLFVIMMLNIKIVELHEEYTKYIPLGIIIISIIFINIIYVLYTDKYIYFDILPNEKYFIIINNIDTLDNIQTIGVVLYTWFSIPFIIASIILFIAMIGAISLTLNKNISYKKQNIYIQTQRTLINTIKLKQNSIK